MFEMMRMKIGAVPVVQNIQKFVAELDRQERPQTGKKDDAPIRKDALGFLL